MRAASTESSNRPWLQPIDAYHPAWPALLDLFSDRLDDFDHGIASARVTVIAALCGDQLRGAIALQVEPCAEAGHSMHLASRPGLAAHVIAVATTSVDPVLERRLCDYAASYAAQTLGCQHLVHTQRILRLAA